MSSVSNSNPNPNINLNPTPWTLKDCSQGICSLYCPQWCYTVYPPPPPSILLSDGDDGTSGFEFSPLIVAVIGILASTFILVTYYTIMSRFCRNRRSINDDGNSINELAQASSPASNSGLDEALIKSITVFKYNKSGGIVEGHDCSVCLSEFEENETLRLLPKCNHAFHLPCIDTWLKSHATCPLCRSTITVCPSPSMEPPPRIIVNALEHQQRSDHVVVVVVESSEQQGRLASFGAHVMPKLAVEDGDSIEQREGH